LSVLKKDSAQALSQQQFPFLLMLLTSIGRVASEALRNTDEQY
jgi:hypothetical protein